MNICVVYICVFCTHRVFYTSSTLILRLTWSAGRDRTMVSVRLARTVQRGARQTNTRGPGSHAALRCPARVRDVSARRSRTCRERARARLPPVEPEPCCERPVARRKSAARKRLWANAECHPGGRAGGA